MQSQSQLVVNNPTAGECEVDGTSKDRVEEGADDPDGRSTLKKAQEQIYTENLNHMKLPIFDQFDAHNPNLPLVR